MGTAYRSADHLCSPWSRSYSVWTTPNVLSAVRTSIMSELEMIYAYKLSCESLFKFSLHFLSFMYVNNKSLMFCLGQHSPPLEALLSRLLSTVNTLGQRNQSQCPILQIWGPNFLPRSLGPSWLPLLRIWGCTCEPHRGADTLWVWACDQQLVLSFPLIKIKSENSQRRNSKPMATLN